MKDKLLLFIIGVLVGAIISTGAFYAYTTTSNTCNDNKQMRMTGGNPPDMPNGEQGNRGDTGNRGNQGEQSQMPNDNSSQVN